MTTQIIDIVPDTRPKMTDAELLQVLGIGECRLTLLNTHYGWWVLEGI